VRARRPAPPGCPSQGALGLASVSGAVRRHLACLSGAIVVRRDAWAWVGLSCKKGERIDDG